jgi:hypothetical protein
MVISCLRWERETQRFNIEQYDSIHEKGAIFCFQLVKTGLKNTTRIKFWRVLKGTTTL